MSTYSPSINQDARTHAEHECEIRYLKRLVERKLKEMMFAEQQTAPPAQVVTGSLGAQVKVAIGS
mgnify:CR=1 FL=1